MRTLNLCIAVGCLLTSLVVIATEQATPPKNVAKAPEQAIKFDEGLYYIVLKAGTGKTADKEYVKNLTTAWTSKDGKTQFNAKEDGIDVSAPDALAAMVPGLAKALKATPVGEKRRWWVAATLMQPGWGGIVPGDYTLDMEVLAGLDPLPAPATVAKAPAHAITSKTGLQYEILTKSKNSRRPISMDTVKVHYSGWTLDGKMFDSSLLREREIEFPLNRVIKGWTEGLQYMSEGDKFRFWIPSALAYGESPRPGAPKGDLVFDVELFEIKTTPKTPKP